MVTTASGAKGTSMVTAGTSVGTHEVTFAYDEGQGWMGKDWKGKGVGRAVAIVEQVIAPALIGMDAGNQRAVDQVLLSLDDTPGKTKLGGNATASVSAAVLRAGSRGAGPAAVSAHWRRECAHLASARRAHVLGRTPLPVQQEIGHQADLFADVLWIRYLCRGFARSLLAARWIGAS